MDEISFVIMIISILIILYIIIEKGNYVTKKIDNLMDKLNKQMDSFFKK